MQKVTLSKKIPHAFETSFSVNPKLKELINFIPFNLLIMSFKPQTKKLKADIAIHLKINPTPNTQNPKTNTRYLKNKGHSLQEYIKLL